MSHLQHHGHGWPESTSNELMHVKSAGYLLVCKIIWDVTHKKSDVGAERGRAGKPSFGPSSTEAFPVLLIQASRSLQVIPRPCPPCSPTACTSKSSVGASRRAGSETTNFLISKTKRFLLPRQFYPCNFTTTHTEKAGWQAGQQCEAKDSVHVHLSRALILREGTEKES